MKRGKDCKALEACTMYCMKLIHHIEMMLNVGFVISYQGFFNEVTGAAKLMMVFSYWNHTSFKRTDF